MFGRAAITLGIGPHSSNLNNLSSSIFHQMCADITFLFCLTKSSGVTAAHVESPISEMLEFVKHT